MQYKFKRVNSLYHLYEWYRNAVKSRVDLAVPGGRDARHPPYGHISEQTQSSVEQGMQQSLRKETCLEKKHQLALAPHRR